MDALIDGRCPSTGKVCWSRRSKAKKAAKRLGKQHKRCFSVYRCRGCGSYHLSTRNQIRRDDSTMATATTGRGRRAPLPTPESIPHLGLGKIKWDGLLKLVKGEVELHGRSLIITGANSQGKSSLINGILLVLGELTQKQIPEPILEGRDHAAFSLELIDPAGKTQFIVERTWSGGGTKLTITAPDGHEYRDVDALLKAFLGEICLTPFAWLKLRPQDQLEDVLKLFGIKPPVAEVETITGEAHPPEPGQSASRYLEALAADKTGVYYIRRTEANRVWQLKQAALLEARETLDGMTLPVGISGDDLKTLLAKRSTLDQKRESSRALKTQHDDTLRTLGERERALTGLTNDAAMAQRRAADIERQIAELQAKLEVEHKTIADTAARIAKAQGIIEQIKQDAASDLAAVEASPDPSPAIAEIDRQIADHDRHAKAIAARQAKAADVERLAQENADCQAEGQRLELIMTELRALRANMLNGLDLGVDGLSVGDGRLRLNDKPFPEQAGTRERIIVAAAIGFKRNPKLKIALVDDAEHLDEEGEALLLALAEKYGWQLILAFVVRGQKQLKFEIVEAV